MRSIYTSYAPIYRRSGQTAWGEHMARWTLAMLAERGVTPHMVVDWGCGDGAAAAIFCAAGCQVVGVDSSPAMLALARERELPGVRWLQADLRDAATGVGASLATAFYDTLNYLLSVADLQAAWRSIAASLAPGGYAVADVNTPYEYAVTWNGRHTVTADTDDVLVVNRLRYNARQGIARGKITWFAHDERCNGWRRGSETHLQRAHSDDELAAAIQAAGLRLVERRTPHGAAPGPTATRVIYVASKI